MDNFLANDYLRKELVTQSWSTEAERKSAGGFLGKAFLP
jgi:hypothetical protein